MSAQANFSLSSPTLHFPFLSSGKNSYAQCLPMRFKKELIRAAASKENSDHIAVEGMVRVLHNIGYQEHLSPSEIQQIFEEHGNGNEISVARLVQLI